MPQFTLDGATKLGNHVDIADGAILLRANVGNNAKVGGTVSDTTLMDSAVVQGGARVEHSYIGQNSRIAGSTVLTHSRVGQNCSITTRATISHVTLEDNAHVREGAVLGQGVTLRQGADVNGKVHDGITVPENTIVAAHTEASMAPQRFQIGDHLAIHLTDGHMTVQDLRSKDNNTTTLSYSDWQNLEAPTAGTLKRMLMSAQERGDLTRKETFLQNRDEIMSHAQAHQHTLGAAQIQAFRDNQNQLKAQERSQASEPEPQAEPAPAYS